MLALLTIAARMAATQTAVGEAPQIVVTASHHRCTMRLAANQLSGADLDRLHRMWGPGQAVRVVMPETAGLTCKIRIMDELQRHNITQAIFVPPEPAAGK